MTAKINHIVVLIFLLSSFLYAQSSVHLFDKSHHQNIYEKTTEMNLISNNSTQLTKKVFGFLPYWELYDTSQTSRLTLRYDLLTHLAVFDFVLQNDGTVNPPPEWPERWLPIIADAGLNNVKVIMTISNLSLTDTDSLLVSNLINSESARNKFFSDVKFNLAQYNFDGINLDFENPKLSERGVLMNNFVQELRDSLDTWFTDKELSFATPAVNWGSRWKLKELSEICDYLFIMAYDYHGSWSTNAGPVAPLSGNTNYNPHNYETTIGNDYAVVNPDKLILGVPYYGAEWLTDTYDPYTDVTPEYEENSNWVEHVDYEDVHYLFKDYNYLTFDGISKTTYVMGPQGDKFKLIWIDSAPMLGLKYDFAIEKNLGGIGIWSLGKDGSHPELWDLIETKFTDTTTSVKDENLVKDFVLFQNYPNPFNPITTIAFTIPIVETGHAPSLPTKLVVYDILGREVVTLVNQKLQPGNHEVNFNASSLSSGLYFYRFDVGNEFSSIKKMILIK